MNRTAATVRNRIESLCPTCGTRRNSWSHNQTDEMWLAEHDAAWHGPVMAGTPVTRQYVTDTSPYVVIAMKGPKKAVLAPLDQPETPREQPFTDGPYPVIHHVYTVAEIAQHVDPTHTVEMTQRKDGKWRMSGTPTGQSGSALRLGVALLRIDYRV